MMLGWHGREDGIDTFPFTLARALGKSLEEIESLSNYEILLWRVFYQVEIINSKMKRS